VVPFMTLLVYQVIGSIVLIEGWKRKGEEVWM
jgi:hypothetical protein